MTATGNPSPACSARSRAQSWSGHCRCVIGEPRLPADADFAIQRVIASRGDLPNPEVRLLPHRNPDTNRTQVFLCHAPVG